MEDWKERLRIKRELLEVKLAANAQRRFRDEYLAELPEQLGTYLEGCPFVVAPELGDFARWFYVSPHGVWCYMSEVIEGTYFTPQGYLYREMSWSHQLLKAALAVSDEHDEEEALFYPFGGPVYHVPFGWVRQNLMALFRCQSHANEGIPRGRHCPERVGVVSADFRAGLVLDNYAGVLPKDPNPDETIYQLAMWGWE